MARTEVSEGQKEWLNRLKTGTILEGWGLSAWLGMGGESVVGGGMGKVRSGRPEFEGKERRNVSRDGKIDVGGKGRFSTNEGRRGSEEVM